jgi:arylsulfatase A-like enzyme
MSLGEHNRTGKSNINDRDQRCWPIYPEIAHVPFMIAAPSLKGGRKISQMTQPADILPTLLDLARIKVKTPEPLHGKSLAPLLRGRSTKAVREFVVTASCLRSSAPKKPRRKAVTPVLYTKKWAYVPFGPRGRPELFDLAADPYAAKNIAAKHPPTVKRLHAKLVAWLRQIDAPPETTAVFE